MWYRYSQNNNGFPEEINLDNVKVNPYSEDIFPLSEKYSPSDVLQHIAITFKMKLEELLPDLKKLKKLDEYDRSMLMWDVLRAAIQASKDSIIFLKEMGHSVNLNYLGKPFQDVNLLIDKAYEDAKMNSRISFIISNSEPETIQKALLNFWKFFRHSLIQFFTYKDVKDSFDTPVRVDP